MKNRIKEIDILYTLGILLVVIGHSHSSDWNTFEGTALAKIIYFIYTFHMPLFFVIAGFLFQHSNRLSNDGYIKWTKDKAMRLLVPYVFWSLVAAIPIYYFKNHTLKGLVYHVAQGLIVPRADVWGHFWFLPVLFLTYMIFGAIRTSDKIPLLPVIILSGIVYFLPIKTQLFGLSDLKCALIFFALGILLNKIPRSIRVANLLQYTICLCIVVISFLLTDICYRNNVIHLIVSIGMISVLWIISLSLPETKISYWISCHNMTMFMFSWFFQSVVMVLCGHFQLGWISTFAMMFLSGFFGPVMMIMVYERTPFAHMRFLRLVLGMR